MPNHDEIALAKYRIEKAKDSHQSYSLMMDFMRIVQIVPTMLYFIQ